MDDPFPIPQWIYNPIGAFFNAQNSAVQPKKPLKPMEPSRPPETAPDPYGLNSPDQAAYSRAGGRALLDSRDSALGALKGAEGYFDDFRRKNAEILKKAREDWQRGIDEYEDFSAQSAVRQVQGFDKQFETTAQGFRDQARGAGVPDDQIDGTIALMRMENGAQKGTLLAELSAKVNETRLAAERAYFDSYYSLAGSFESAEGQLGFQYDTAIAEMNRWWGETWSNHLTQAELLEQQAEQMMLTV